MIRMINGGSGYITSPAPAKFKRARKRKNGEWRDGYDQGVRDALLIASVFALAIILCIGALIAIS